MTVLWRMDLSEINSQDVEQDFDETRCEVEEAAAAESLSNCTATVRVVNLCFSAVRF